MLGILLARIVLAGRWPRWMGIGVSLALCALGYASGFVVPFQYSSSPRRSSRSVR
ncbi:hypothetical protein AB0L10_15825 [Streptomyces flaveolus]|uniref:hypothetical protein n=1 Tax=Streptomyces flaveolus TaxID=67297 RepID=UPI003427B59D